jgi:hypothetical protein
MAGAVRSFMRAAWSAIAGGDRARPAERGAGVVVHDPAARKAQNLDDPFLESAAQKRVGDLIARSVRRPEDR